jgi:hypothetical protein
MSVHAGPNVVENGLVLALDAANPKSYPGTGTTWSNLTGSGSGVLTNGPTFDGVNNGRIIFDGSNDYANAATTGVFIPNNFTYEIWCIPTTTHQIDSQTTSGTGGVSGQRYLMDPAFVDSPNAGSGISIGTNGVSVYEHSAAYMPATLVDTTAISSTLPTQINVVYSNKQPSLYLNSNFIKTGLTSPRTNIYVNIVWVGGSASGYGYFQGSIFLVRVYNRALSAAEIQQNYNATRSRFGI